ncbi:Mur ligase [Francisella tularensis]|uniref:Mur ligase family protein n=1 Tax=Francisella tularensis TaxID=263 RepID=UPI000A163399|nr:Mur ligase family protein [Francisella tularensis]MBK2149778.1 Mur ligase [Francisella tularensis]MBK2250918.1 Mur ligase [Francisella tularensis]NDS80561.1 Mur ligase [Francisella tularensis subsp. holarctica]NDT60501.1 Mur ligase [Francisella tularensis subsp. holarctica]ORX28794.1 Mur ligase [Francisella tularensis subsp. holarctica]
MIPEGYSRRLVGPNLFFKETGTVLDVPLVDNRDELTKLFYQEANRILLALDWQDIKITHKFFNNGVRFAMTAPVDITMPACDVIDFIWLSTREGFETGVFKTIEEAKRKLIPLIDEDKNLTYRKLYELAKSKGFNAFRDKNKAFIGSGRGCYEFDLDNDSIDDIPWQDIYDIPAVIVTGTNGKTTTVRLTDYICRVAGKLTGYTSTDWVKVNDQLIDEGDYSGPTGHQFVLTNKKVEVALLESARGGLLKRGLIETYVNAAAVTNVSADHLGEDGIETVAELAEAKSIVFRALGQGSHGIINLDNSYMKERFDKFSCAKIVVTQNPQQHDMKYYLSKADYACIVEDGNFVWVEANSKKVILPVIEAPLTVRSFAKHNIENAMIAIALSFKLGISFDVIEKALRSYSNDPKVNRGRANVFEWDNKVAILDYAHNEAGMEALLNMVKAYDKGGKKYLMIGTTGDRKYLISGINDIILKHNLDFIVIKETEKYLRGAKPLELPLLIRKDLADKGYDISNTYISHGEIDGVKFLVEKLESNDMAIFCCQAELEEVANYLEECAKK